MEKPVASRHGAGASLAEVFALMRRGFSEAVVERALHFRGKASKRVQSVLDSALRSELKVRGFRDASKASPQHLVVPVLVAIEKGNGRLAGAMLRVWDESQGQLRARVTDHVRQAGITPAKPDYKANRFTATWLVEEWVRHREAVAGEHQEFNEDEVALMLCLVAGRAPVPELREALMRIQAPLFRDWIRELLDLSPEAPAWADIDPFKSAVGQIATGKAKEKSERETVAVRVALEGIQEVHKDEIKYLDLDMRLWLPKVKDRLDLMPEALDVLSRLEKELQAYRPVRPQGTSREDERRRAKERGDRESAILGLAKEWQAITAKPAKPAAVADERAVLKVGAETDAGELSQLRIDHKALQTQHEQLIKERDEANSARQLERTQLKQQIADLEHQLDQWRQAYKAEADGKPADEAEQEDATEEEPAELASLDEAIARAKAQFDGTLVFALNNKSRTNIPFQKPQEVFDVFAWLATEFRKQRQNPGPSPDFNLSLKQVCPNWFYKPNQTKTTMGMYSDWYKTDCNGKTYELSNHIGKGASFDPRSTIRVAFAWDEEEAQVVVGFVGPHQRNRQS